MKREDKELLLKDLCARLPYDVCVHIRYKDGEPCYGKLTPRDIQWFIDSKIEVIKPYLRPMSSMTEEEKKELKCLFDAKNITNDSICFLEGGTLEEYEAQIPFSFCSKLIDWLNAHYFDYRGLIEKGLALEAPEGMYLKEE